MKHFNVEDGETLYVFPSLKEFSYFPLDSLFCFPFPPFIMCLLQSQRKKRQSEVDRTHLIANVSKLSVSVK